MAYQTIYRKARHATAPVLHLLYPWVYVFVVLSRVTWAALNKLIHKFRSGWIDEISPMYVFVRGEFAFFLVRFLGILKSLDAPQQRLSNWSYFCQTELCALWHEPCFTYILMGLRAHVSKHIVPFGRNTSNCGSQTIPRSWVAHR